MNIENLESQNQDKFGLRKLDFSKRVPEHSEMFDAKEAKTYIDGCDYADSVDDLLLAWEIQDRFSHIGIENMRILDAMCGPGRLGRELLNLGARNVTFLDGDETMINHANKQASLIIQPGQHISSVVALVDNITIRDDVFDLVVCHNSTHQLTDTDKLRKTLEEFIRVTKPGGFVLIADYQRNTSPKFLAALEERLTWTKPEIVPLLVPTFSAAFSKEEFDAALESLPGIRSWLVTDAALPNLTNEMQERVNRDPVKGHVLDFSPISLRAIAQKEEV
jgi:ubiquinone/menaquinone biosynthesis C-methylase UbiE